MANWTLQEIRQKVRQVTGRYQIEDLSNTQIDEYINKYFQYTFPAEVKLERFHTFYELVTVANQQSYNFPSGYINFDSPATIDRMQIDWYQDYYRFYQDNPQNVSRQTLGTGDDVTTNFTGTASSFPIVPGTTIVTDGVETFTDTSTTYSTAAVNLTSTGLGNGTLNMSTGAVNVNFATAPVTGANVYFSYVQFIAGRPTAVLVYNNQFTFYPIPDQAYRFQVSAWANTLVTTAAGVNATQFVNATDTPLLDEWGPSIAYGAARDIHSDFGEMDAYQEVTGLYKEQISYILRRTHQNLFNMRAKPQF